MVHLAEVDSTNDTALRYAAEGEVGPLWISADVQRAGRGRSGRHWTSLPGNLSASLLLTLPVPQPKAYQLSLVAGVAVAHAILRTAPELAGRLQLKWPNDILVEGAKAGGILIESTTKGDAVAAVIGLGINVVGSPDELDRAVTCLGAHGGTVPSSQQLLEQVASEMECWLDVWSYGDGFAAVREAWLRTAHPLGEELRINAGETLTSGAFAGLSEDGALLLAGPDGAIRSFSYGDVDIARRGSSDRLNENRKR